METEQTMKSGILKRILTFALSCAMLLSCVPAAVFADAPFGTQAIEVGVETTATIQVRGTYAYFSFTPEQTERYTFYSLAEGQTDTYGHLYDSDMNELTSDDDSGITYNFAVSYKLQAGVTYYFGARYRSRNEYGSFPVMLEISHEWNEENVCSYCGQEFYKSGACGESLTWELNHLGTLTISGEGGMPNYGYRDPDLAPWNAYSSMIKEVVIGDGVTDIGTYLCNDCDNLQTVTIGSGVENIRGNMLIHCDGFTTIYIPANVKKIGIDSFFGCSSFQEYVVSPDNPNYTSVDGVLFSKDKTTLVDYPIAKAGDYTIPEGTESIYDHAFSDCEKLSSVVIPKSVTLIMSSAFSSKSIKTVTFTGAAPTIDDYAFSGNVTVVRYPGNDPSWTADKLKDYRGALTWFPSDSTDIPTAQTITPGVEYTVNIENGGDCAYFQITPEADGLYNFFSTGVCNTVGYLFDSNMNLLESNTGSRDNFSIKSILKAGQTYVLGARYYESDATGSFTVVLTEASYREIAVGAEAAVEIKEGGRTAFFGFTPTVSGNYMIYAKSDRKVFGDLYDGQFNHLDPDNENRGHGYSIAYQLVAGQTYYLGVNYNDNSATGTVTAGLYPIEAQTIHAGAEAVAEINKAGRPAFFSFTPEATDIYTFSSMVNATYGELYDSGMELLESCGYDKNGRFYITSLLQRGHTYYFSAGYNAPIGPEQTGSYTVKLEQIHEGSAISTEPAGCTTDGLLTKLCDYCGEEFTEVIPATGHSWNQEKVCSVCGKDLDESGTCGENLTWKLNKEGTLTITGSGAMDNYESPYTGGVLAPWYNYNEIITNVVVGKNVTTIGEFAFCNCFNVEQVKIGGKVTSIGIAAFDSCSKLTSITIPANVKSIGVNAFGYSGITNILVADANTAYTSVDGVLFSKDKATLVAYPSGRAGAYTIPNGTKTIGDSAFAGCNKLSEVVIPDSVTKVGNAAFRDCVSLEKLQMGNGIKTIDDDAFSFCTNLKQVIIPDSVTTIGQRAFGYCINAETLRLGEAVTTIGDYAFAYMPALREVTIPASVTTIGEYAFFQDRLLTSIAFAGEAPSISYTAFTLVTAEVQYPGKDTSWTVDKKQNYGGMLTWHSDTPNSIMVRAGSEDQVYVVGDTVSLDAIRVIAFFDDGEVAVPISRCSVTLPDMSTPGRKPVVVSYGDASDSFEIGVHQGTSLPLSPEMYPESDHNYGNNSDKNWIVNIPGADQISLVFSNDTYVEDGSDFITVSNGSDFFVIYTGGQAAGRQVLVPGDTAIIYLTSDGSVTKYGFSFSSISGLKIEHVGENLENHQPTCEEDGWIPAYTCTICGREIAKQILPATGHKYEEGKCTVCGKPESIASGESGAVSWYLTEGGVLTISGTGAMADYSAETPAPWQTYADKITKVVIDSGVTAIGAYAFCELPNLPTIQIPASVQAIGCNGLSANEELVVVFLGDAFQNPDDQSVSAYSITAYYPKGNTTWTEELFASFGENVTWREIQCKEGLEHEIVIDKAVDATCSATGLTEGSHCSACGEIIVAQAETEKLSHTEVIDEAVDPTCSATGLTEGKHCSVCGEIIVPQIVLDKLAHTEATDEAVDPTCTETGLTEGKHCSVCGEVIVPQETIDALGHKEEVTIPGKEATCTEDGLLDKKVCSVCGEVTQEQKVIPAGHKPVHKKLQKATAEEDGIQEHYECSVCRIYLTDETGEVVANEEDYKIPAVDIVRLSSTRYSYDGKTKTPKVGVYDSKGKRLVKDVDYTVTYAKGRKSVGKYNVTMKGIGNYSFRTTLTFQIVPPKSAVYTPKALDNGFTAKWVKKTSQVTGYQLQYSLNKDFSDAKTVTIKDSSVVSKSIKKLKNKKTYYVRIRTYKVVGSSKFYSDWSAAKTVKTK